MHLLRHGHSSCVADRQTCISVRKHEHSCTDVHRAKPCRIALNITGSVHYVQRYVESAVKCIFRVSVSCGLPRQPTSQVGGTEEVGLNSSQKVVNLAHIVVFCVEFIPYKMPAPTAVLMPVYRKN